MMKQNTIKKPVTVKGIGLHTGKEVVLTFKPAPVGHGYKFQRIDLEGGPVLNADVNRVVSTQRGTTIKSGTAEVNTVEHALSALVGLGIDNVLIELNGPEVPILDGSAAPFVKALKKAGLEPQEADREFFVIETPIHYKDEKTGAELLALPHDGFELIAMIDFNSNVLGQQYARFNGTTNYEKEIAPCRTFVFLHELEFLFEQNLIKGGDLDNAIVIVDRVVSQDELDRIAEKLGKPSVTVDQEGILNTIKLHYKNEPARHKLLDAPVGRDAHCAVEARNRVALTLNLAEPTRQVIAEALAARR